MTISRFIVSKEDMVFSAIRAQGAGGQNVNKVSSAVHLRYSIPRSSLPPEIKERLLALRDQRIQMMVTWSSRRRAVAVRRRIGLTLLRVYRHWSIASRSPLCRAGRHARRWARSAGGWRARLYAVW